MAFHSSHIDEGSLFNRARSADPVTDDLIERGTNEFDLEKRIAIWHEFQRHVMDRAVFLPLWEDAYIWILPDNLSGWDFDGLGNPLIMRSRLTD